MVDWKIVFRPFIGRELTNLAFESIPCDTGLVFDGLEKTSVSYSGCVNLRFSENLSVRLTWEFGPRGITPLALEDWREENFDRIHAPWEHAWSKILGQKLSQVEIFDFDGYPSGARHTFEGGSFLWIATSDVHMAAPGSPAPIHPMDDLWVSVDQNPSNLEEGRLIALVG